VSPDLCEVTEFVSWSSALLSEDLLSGDLLFEDLLSEDELLM